MTDPVPQDLAEQGVRLPARQMLKGTYKKKSAFDTALAWRARKLSQNALTTVALFSMTRGPAPGARAHVHGRYGGKRSR
jgi:hypothetical protein